VREYREQFAQGGITMTTIAQDIGMSLAGVSRFLKGQTYTHAGGPLLG
jgi:DNA transposition AAA+ family ATPase